MLMETQIYGEGNYKRIIWNQNSKNDLILSNFEAHHLPIPQEDLVTIIH